MKDVRRVWFRAGTAEVLVRFPKADLFPRLVRRLREAEAGSAPTPVLRWLIDELVVDPDPDELWDILEGDLPTARAVGRSLAWIVRKVFDGTRSEGALH